ncbi:MAG: hypothetical protein PHG08_01100 [Bacilli bacterium]|nr:hypothetical protein [Bacilli bacterium]
MKKCTKCGVEKDLVEFSKCKENKDGLQFSCKECAKKYRKNNIEKNKKYQKEYYKNNIEKLIEYRKNNIEKNKKYQKEYYKNNIEKLIEYRKEYYKNNSKYEKVYQKEYRKNNPEYRKEYYKNNIERLIEYRKNYRKNNPEYDTSHHYQRKLIDPLYKLRCNIRSCVYNSIKKMGFKKNTKTAIILGCTFEEFKLHIEKQFTDGMVWTNQGKWHLDHIYPVSLAVDEQHLLQLNHYTNFQPLWAEDNLKKGNKIVD